VHIIPSQEVRVFLRRFAGLVGLAFVLSLTIGCTVGEKRVKLRFKYEPGQVLDYLQTNKTNIVYESKDSVLEKKSRSYDMRVVLEVDEVADDGSARVKEIVDWPEIVKNKKDTTLLDTVKRTREVIIEVLPDGKIVDMEFESEMNAGSVDWLKKYYEQAMPVFPASDAFAGFHWTQTSKVVLPDETVEASITFKLTSFVRESGYDCAVIEYDGNLIIPWGPMPDDTTHRSGVDRIATDGVMYFAYKEGFVVLQRERYILEGDREQLKKGELFESRVTAETDLEYALVRRKP
jgi:hypothetical protein